MRKVLTAILAVAVAMVGFATTAEAAPGDKAKGASAEIEVTWDGCTATITSTKAISNIIVTDDEGNVVIRWEMTEGSEDLDLYTAIVEGAGTVWVKSGNNGGDEGPAGAGEEFSTDSSEECVPSDATSVTYDGGDAVAEEDSDDE